MNDSPELSSLTLPTQVWPQLTADRQHRAIRCLAQLAFNVVTASSDHNVSEVDHEHPNRNTQTA